MEPTAIRSPSVRAAIAPSLIGLAVVALLALLCLVAPFLPGRHEPLASVVSDLVRLFGVVGLLLVPAGILWLVHELRRAARMRRGMPVGRALPWAVVALVVSVPVVAAPSLGAFALSGPVLGVVVAFLSAAAWWKLRRRMRERRSGGEEGLDTIPLWLVVLPSWIALVEHTALDDAAAFARGRAVENSSALLAGLRDHRASRGRYPSSLEALHQDEQPGIAGIDRYRYRCSAEGDAFELFFETPSVVLGTRELVVYSERDAHAIPGHDSDILLWTDQELRERAGHYAVLDGPAPRWKRLLYD